MQRTCLSIIALLLLLSHLTYCRVERLEREEATRSSENARDSELDDDGESVAEKASSGDEDSTAPGSEIAEDSPPELEKELIPAPKHPKSSPSPKVEAKPSLEPSMEMPKTSSAPPASSPVPRRRRRHPKDPVDDEPTVERRFIYETRDSEKDGSSSTVSTNSAVAIHTDSEAEQSSSTSHGSSAGMVVGVLFAVGTVVVVGGFIGYKAWQRIELSRYRGWRPYDVEMIELQSQW